MPPAGLAIIIGAGPNTGTGIARILSHPSHGNYAIALLARQEESLDKIKKGLQAATPGLVIETFPTDTSEASILAAFTAIRACPSFAGLKLKVSIFSIKHASKGPFMSTTYADFTHSLETYAGGAFIFAQESIRLFYDHHGDGDLEATNGAKKGTLIFTGTLGALRASAEYAAYGAGRAGVRQLAQSLARELSPKGIHVVHAIANGGIMDENGEAQKVGKKMSADAVGKTYLWLSQQDPELWTHELDLRPALEKF